jgi:hypothetical protein
MVLKNFSQLKKQFTEYEMLMIVYYLYISLLIVILSIFTDEMKHLLLDNWLIHWLELFYSSKMMLHFTDSSLFFFFFACLFYIDIWTNS